MTSPIFIKDEGTILNNLLAFNSKFLLHLRKENSELNAYKKLLDEIDVSHQHRIVLHDHHQLIMEYNVKGLHLKSYLKKESEKYVSTSLHFGDNINIQDFEYFFCSPVFNSISKLDYLQKNWNIKAESESFKKKAIALGGITTSNLDKAKEKGFENFAFMGAIWLSENPIASAKNILNNA